MYHTNLHARLDHFVLSRLSQLPTTLTCIVRLFLGLTDRYTSYWNSLQLSNFNVVMNGWKQCSLIFRKSICYKMLTVGESAYELSLQFESIKADMSCCLQLCIGCSCLEACLCPNHGNMRKLQGIIGSRIIHTGLFPGWCVPWSLCVVLYRHNLPITMFHHSPFRQAPFFHTVEDPWIHRSVEQIQTEATECSLLDKPHTPLHLLSLHFQLKAADAC